MHWKSKLAVVYYGAADVRGCRLALAIAEGAWNAGAEVRVRSVEPLTPPGDAHSAPEWEEVLCEADDVPEVSAEDLAWADAVLFGTSTGESGVDAQLGKFLHALPPFRGAVVLPLTDGAPTASPGDDAEGSSLTKVAGPPTAKEIAAARDHGRRVAETVIALNAVHSARAAVA